MNANKFMGGGGTKAVNFLYKESYFFFFLGGGGGGTKVSVMQRGVGVE